LHSPSQVKTPSGLGWAEPIVSRQVGNHFVELNRFGPYLAEAIATFTLVFAGCGAIVIDTVSHGQVTHVGVAVSFGLAIAAMIYGTGHISGAHINPAVTLAFALTRHFPLARVPGYWAAQLFGAATAAGVLRALFGNVAHLGATIPSDGDGQSFVLEIVLTFFLMFVIMAVATDDRAVGQAAALAIGGTVLLDAMFGGPISGASMNPARSFGPALVSGSWDHFWIYVAGPILGALVAAFAYELVRGERPRPGIARSESEE
jgi:MIP family channel proteins